MKKFLGVILPMLIGGVCGAAGAAFGVSLLPEIDGGKGLILIGLSLIFSIYFHIIVHEGGHLVCGLLSGYKFVSFRNTDFNIKVTDIVLYAIKAYFCHINISVNSYATNRNKSTNFNCSLNIQFMCCVLENFENIGVICTFRCRSKAKNEFRFEIC